MRLSSLFFFALFLFPCPSASAQLQAPDLQALDDFLRATYPADAPGAVVLAALEGEILLHEGYGLADLEEGRPMDRNLAFPVASVTKQFTSLAIHRMAARGVFSLEDAIATHLPGFSLEGGSAPIATLLNHTAGIPDYVRVPAYDEARMHPMELSEVTDLFAPEPLSWEPGTRWGYSNSGYVLLSALLEAASGKKWHECLAEEVLHPLGLGDTRAVPQGPLHEEVRGYEWAGGIPVCAQDQDVSHNAGAGALISSALDLFRFQQALEARTGPLAGILDQMAEPTGLLANAPFEYGKGFWLADFGRHRLVEGEGYMPGFYHRTLSIPEEGVFVAVLTNSSGAEKPDDPVFVSRWIAARLLGEGWPDFRAAAEDSTDLSQFVGVYRLTPETTVEVTEEDGFLHTMWSGARRYQATNAGENQFFFPGTFSAFHFEGIPSGRLQLHWETREGVQRGELTDIPIRRSIQVSQEVLGEYAGIYDFGFTRFRISLEGSGLSVDDGRRIRLLLPRSETEFFPADEDSHWEFQRKPNGGMHLSLTFGERVWEADRMEGGG